MTDMIDDPAAQAVRRPPQSINSEQSILGGLMIDNNALDSIVDIIQPDDFYRRDHKIIYEHIAAMIQRGRPADSLTVAESLRDAGLDTDTGGFAYETGPYSDRGGPGPGGRRPAPGHEHRP